MKGATKLILLAAFLASVGMVFVDRVIARQSTSLPEPEDLAKVANGGGPVVSVDPLTSTVASSGVFTVGVMVEGAENRLAGYSFRMDFDPAVVQVEDVVDGGFLGSLGRTVIPEEPSIMTGTVSFGAYSQGSEPAPTGSGRLAVVTLEAVGGVGDTSPLDLYDVRLYDIGGAIQPIDEAVDGTVVVTTCQEATIDTLASDSPVILGRAMHFTATVGGTKPISYTWDFGGVGSAIGEGTATPAFTYTAAGTYTVGFTATNACGVATDTLEVEVEPKPCEPVSVESLTSDSPVALGQAMHFTATVGGTEPVSYTWNFGGVGSATGEGTAAPAFTYEAVGEYTVAVTATNACGVATDTLEVEVQPCDPVSIEGLASDSPVFLGKAMYFTATVGGTEPVSYTWDFGGAGSATGEETANPTFAYEAAGEYTVVVTATNPCGEAVGTLEVEVEPCDPVSIESLTSDSPVVLGEAIQFGVIIAGTRPVSYAWDFGGAGSATGEGTATPTFTYEAAGEYTVVVTATNACGEAVGELEVEVEPEPCDPVSIESVVSDSPVVLGGMMHFTATVGGTVPIIYTWDFGGAGTATGEGTATPTFTYEAAGAYTVVVTVTNACGEAVDTLEVDVEPGCEPVSIESLTSDSPVLLGQAMHFTATVGGTEPISYTWDFGGVGSAMGEGTAIPAFTYTAAGTYTVGFTATNACGVATDTLEVEVEPKPCEPVSIESLTSDSPVVLGEAMHLTATVGGTEPVSYTWDFGGAGSATGEETATPTVTYEAAGAYTVVVTATNACGEAVEALEVDVEPGCDPVSIESVTSNSPVVLGEAMHFTATASGSRPVGYTWDLGGAGAGTGLDTATPRFTYIAVGEYTVVVTATNACGEAVETLEVEVEPRCDPVTIEGLTSDSPVVLGEAIQFGVIVAGTRPISYAWDFGGAGSATGEGTATPTFTYEAVGEYTVVVTATNACGEAVGELEVEVQPQPCDPVSIESLTSNSPVMLGETMRLTATATGAEPISYIWDFGGPGSATGRGTATPTFTYDAAGEYVVVVTATNACGEAVDALEVEVAEFTYRIYQPLVVRGHAACEPVSIESLTSDSPVMLGEMMHFIATVGGTEPVSYAWDFGGAGSATGDGTATPVFSYDAGGSYTVFLTATNSCATVTEALDVRVEATCTEMIVNGGFELDAGWDIPAVPYPAAYVTPAAYSGSRSMRTGIVDPADNIFSYSSAWQTVSVPTDAFSIELSYHILPVSGESVRDSPVPDFPLTYAVEEAALSGDVQYVLILDQAGRQLGGPLIWRRSNSRQWSFHQIDLNKPLYTGRSIELVFGAFNDGVGGVTGLYVDDVSLEVCYSIP